MTGKKTSGKSGSSSTRGEIGRNDGFMHNDSANLTQTYGERAAADDEKIWLTDRRTGRPPAFSVEIGMEICSRIAQGESLNRICKDSHIPSKGTVIGWHMYPEESPGDTELLRRFSYQYAKARIVQAEGFVDECADIADDSSEDWEERENKKTDTSYLSPNHEVINRSKLRVNTRQWLAQVYLPKVRELTNNFKIQSQNTSDVNLNLSSEIDFSQFNSEQIVLIRKLLESSDNDSEEGE